MKIKEVVGIAFIEDGKLLIVQSKKYQIIVFIVAIP